MNRRQIRRKQVEGPAPAVTEKRVRQQLGQAAGAEYFQNRDPLYHVTENFQMTFDAMGQRHAAQLAKREGRWDQAGKEPPGQDGLHTDEQMPDKTSTRSFYDRTNPQEQDMLRRFSETSFQRGTLSGAVLRGSGQMMLFSCLKKTVGQNQPDKWQQRKLFEKVSPHRNSPGHNPDKLVFNRGFTDSAVGLVVDTLRDSRRVIDDMRAVVAGSFKNEAGFDGAASTLWKQYPFLDDSRERKLLQEYQTQLENMEDGDPKRSILHNALNRTHALLQKKAQMRIEFMNKLRFISDRATEALEVFEAPGYAEQLHEALLQDLNPEEPPDDGGDDDGAAGTGAAEANSAAGNKP